MWTEAEKQRLTKYAARKCARTVHNNSINIDISISKIPSWDVKVGFT